MVVELGAGFLCHLFGKYKDRQREMTQENDLNLRADLL